MRAYPAAGRTSSGTARPDAQRVTGFGILAATAALPRRYGGYLSYAGLTGVQQASRTVPYLTTPTRPTRYPSLPAATPSARRSR